MKIVIKAGGDLLKDSLHSNLVADLVEIKKEHKVILVHGGADIVTEISTKLGHPPKFVLSPKGFKSRYTDLEQSSIFTMVMSGKINKEIITTLEKNGVSAIGLTGLDAHLLKAERKKRLIIIDENGRKRLIDGGYTGKILDVNVKLLENLITQDLLPVISPVAQGEEFEHLNVDGDRTASAIASAIEADRLILLTDVNGVRLNDSYARKLNVKQAEDALEKMGPGMITKVYAALEALKKNVPEVIIASGLKVSPISKALEHEDCTVISN